MLANWKLRNDANSIYILIAERSKRIREAAYAMFPTNEVFFIKLNELQLVFGALELNI